MSIHLGRDFRERALRDGTAVSAEQQGIAMVTRVTWLILSGLLPAVAGCAYSAAQGSVAEGATVAGYRYAVVSPMMPAHPEAIQELVRLGYWVVSPDAYAHLPQLAIPKGAILFISCAYVGHTASDALGSSGANVSCEAVDFVARTAVYAGTGKHTGMTHEADIAGAVKKALRSLPPTGQAGRVTMVLEFARQRPAASSSSDSLALRFASVGTGFFVADGEHIVTNAHVLEGCSVIRAGGQAVQVVKVDRTNDLALLRSVVRGTPLALRSGPVRLGEMVVAIGYPLSGLLSSEPIVTTGVVNALAGVGDDTRFLQISAAVQPGSSGGPLLDDRGLVIGVVVSKLDAARVFSVTGDIPQNVNFALAPAVLKGFMEAAGATYGTATASRSMSVPDIASAVRAAVIPLSCQ